MDGPLIGAFDLIVLTKLRFIAAPAGAGKIAKMLKRDGVYAGAFEVRQALCRLDDAGRVQHHNEFGDMVPRWTAREPFSN